MPRPNRYYPLSDKPNDKGYWEIVWSEPAPGGRARSRRHSTGETERAAAELYRANWLLTLEKRQTEDAQPETPTVAAVMRAYREGHVAESELECGSWLASTYSVEQSALGKMLVTDLTPFVVNAYGRDRAAGRIGYTLDGEKRGYRKGGPAAFRNDMLCLNSAMRWCVANKVFKKGFTLADLSPVKVPEAPQAKEHYLTIEQGQKLLAAAKALNKPGRYDPLYIFILICFDTAARMVAIEELTWDRVKLKRDERGMWAGEIDFRVPGRKVTKKRRGVNYLSAECAASLALIQQASNHPRVLGVDTSIEYRFRRFTRAVLGQEEGPHILRHSWATWAIADGVAPVTVADVLHDTVATVMKHYRHAMPEQKMNAVAFVAGLLADAAKARDGLVDLETERAKRSAAGGVTGGVTPASGVD